MLMIIYNFHVVCSAILPRKADAPLVVDTNTVLIAATTAQWLQAVGRRNAQIRQIRSGMEHQQFAQRHALNIVRQLPYKFSLENTKGKWRRKTFNHTYNNAKR